METVKFTSTLKRVQGENVFIYYESFKRTKIF